DNLDDEAGGLAAIKQPAAGPFGMDRVRPDGCTLSWRLVIPGGSPWRKPWPFLIEWKTPDNERLQWDFPGTHDNGAVGVKGVDLIVDDLTFARDIYEKAFRMTPSEVSDSTVTYRLGAFSLSLNTPVLPDMRDELAVLGPGPFCLRLRHNNPDASATEIPLDPALGARILIE
ncbi:MAG: VOC family protein, partial [Gammaproteobacteria bacterium]